MTMGIDQTEQMQSNPTDLPFRFDTPGGPVRFENASDTIFASLFLPAFDLQRGTLRQTEYEMETCPAPDPIDFDSESIPWQFCDRILKTLRNPNFNPREITFENCGDMFRRVGEKRQDKWTVAEARPTCSTFPMVVLDEVLDALEAEALHNSRRGDIAWMKTIKNMMFVHSSWHASVKRLLGHTLFSTSGPAPATLQNPIFGGWTKVLYLKYESVSDYFFSNLSIAPSRPHGYFLNTLFARISNIRVVYLCLEETSDIALASACQSLSSLASLEELTLEARYGSLPVQITLAVISKTLHPTLKVIFLRQGSIGLEDLSISIRSLELLKSLHSVHLHHGRYTFRQDIGISDVSWSRYPSISGSPFTTSELQIECDVDFAENVQYSLPETSEGVIQVLQSTKLAAFEFREEFYELERFGRQEIPIPPSSKICELITPWLAQCSSARTLTFRQFPWTQIKTFELIQEQLGAQTRIEELVIEATHLPLPPASTLR